MERILTTCYHILSFVKEQCGDNPDFEVNKVVRSWLRITYRHDDIRCEKCTDKGVAIKYCIDCSYFIDNQCFGYHKIMKDILHHNIVEFKYTYVKIYDLVPRRRCDKRKHSQYELDTYCVHCNELLCRRCIKRHTKRNHYINSLQHLYHLLDQVYETKKKLNDLILRLLISKNSTDIEIAQTIVKWIDKMFELRDFNVVAPPRVVEEILNREKTDSNKRGRNYVSCKAVIEKLTQVHDDLRRIATTQSPRNTNTCRNGDNVGTALSSREYDYAPYRMTEDRALQHQEDGDDGSSSSSSDSSESFEDPPMIVNNGSVITQPEQRRHDFDTPVDKEIEILHIAQDLYQDIHQATTI